MAVCSGTVPTWPGIGSDLVPVLTGNTLVVTANIIGDATSTGFRVSFFRKKGSVPTFDPGEKIGEVALTFAGASPPGGDAFPLADTINDFGDFYYAARIECALDGTNHTTTTSTPSFVRLAYFSSSELTISLNGLTATVTAFATGRFSSNGQYVALYRKEGSVPTFQASELVSRQTIDISIDGEKQYVYSNSIPDAGTWYYIARIEKASGGWTGTDESSSVNKQDPQFAGAELTISMAGTIATLTPVVGLATAVAGFLVKTYRKSGSAPTFLAGELINSQEIPAGTGSQSFPFTDAISQTGTWYYASRIEVSAGSFTDADTTAAVNSGEIGHVTVSDVTWDEDTPTTNDLNDPASLTTGDGNAVPHEGVDELIVLVRVTGTPAGGYTYEDLKIIDAYERMEWDYLRIGGCGRFRLITKEKTEDWETAVDNEYEIHVRIKLPTDTLYNTWYRGVIKSWSTEQSGNQVVTQVEGVGYVDYMNKIMIQKRYPKGLTVRDIMTDIVEHYITPYSRVRKDDGIQPGTPYDPASLMTSSAFHDVTNLRIDASSYQLIGDVNFQCSAFRALKFLAELQGGMEFGVDSSGLFFWRVKSSTIGKIVFLDKDGKYTHGGTNRFDEANKIKVEGEHQGCREHLTMRGDVTDITSRGLFEIPHELPWVTQVQDASRWADNVIAIHKPRQDWRVFKIENLQARLDYPAPINKVRYQPDGDVTNGIETYEVCKIHYYKGGFKSKQEIREVGRTASNDLPQVILSADLYLGYPPKDIVGDIEYVSDQVEALKGKQKQIRYPKDVTNNPRVTGPGAIPGELQHYSKDITNCDITNSPVDIHNSEYARAVGIEYLNNEWMIRANRRQFLHTLPARGRYFGEIVALITDLTAMASDTYRWSGTAWVATGGGEINTASNVGAAGVGVFKQKNLLDLEFKKLNPSSSLLTITDDITNSKIDIDIAPDPASVFGRPGAFGGIYPVTGGLNDFGLYEGVLLSVAGASASIDTDGVFEQLLTNTTLNNDAGILSAIVLHRGDTRPSILFKFRISPITSTRIFIGVSDQGLSTMVDSDNPVGNYVGLQFSSARPDTNWQFVAKNAVTQNLQDSGVAVSTGTFFVRVSGTDLAGGSWLIELFNAAFGPVASYTFTTNIPHSSRNMYLHFSVTNLVGGAGSERSLFMYYINGINRK